MKTSIVIPTYNRKKDLVECIESIYRLKTKPYEIIIVDNSSSDGTQKLIEKKYPDIHLITNKINLGAAQGKNIGAAKSKGDLIWFLDSDTVIQNSNCLKEMLKIFRNDTLSLIGSIGGEYTIQDSRKIYNVFGICLTGRAIKKTYRELTNVVECGYNLTSNLIMKRGLFQKLGGFDPGYFYLGEDKELGLRINKLGLKNIQNEATSIYHKYSSISRISDGEYVQKLYTTRIKMILNNYTIKDIVLFPFREFIHILKSISNFQRLLNELYNLRFIVKALWVNIINIRSELLIRETKC